ncbi:unnamed protein product [Darwinula stevensoni]|uniref:Neurotransmitter-gated ion-channel transmembrane domain-containing protein n=1 Tax=Darwinula stevensoni TaxID=69355 RepID=A0A7R9A9L7_9CRUS|nr:unnamed protein product [Darwinula stevensoni]CAG0897307.1 unnamed protein product [Darwinula stevensoni]
MKNQRIREMQLRERSSKSLIANVLDEDDYRPGLVQGGRSRVPSAFDDPGFASGAGGCGSSSCMAGVKELGLILKEIRLITGKLRHEEEEHEVIGDWKFAAMVVDRICLIIFTLFTAIATIVVLLSAPHLLVA